MLVLAGTALLLPWRAAGRWFLPSARGVLDERHLHQPQLEGRRAGARGRGASQPPRDYHSVFLDLDPEKGIVAGQSWERTLYRKLRACRAVIALCTDDYLRSHWCFAEIALARMEGKPVIGLLADPLDASTTLPGILTERQLIDLRPGEDEGYARLWRALEQLDLKGVATDWNPKEPPYLGLNAYQEEHAPVFFGREEESLAGIELLDRGAPALVLVLGASGSGKSSLVRAGMLPRLRSRDDWLIVDPFRPGRDPWAELTESLVRAFGRYAPDHFDESGATAAAARPYPRRLVHVCPADAARRAREADRGLRRPPRPPTTGSAVSSICSRRCATIRRRSTARVRNYLEWSLDDLRRLSAPPGAPTPAATPAADATPLLEAALDLRRLSHRRNARVLIVIDQFEELLGRENADEDVTSFLTLLRASLEAEHSPTHRAVHDALRLPWPLSAPPGASGRRLREPLARADADRRHAPVITMPARLAAIEIEDGLVDRLLADTGTPDALPLLSFTLWVMCRDRARGRAARGRGLREARRTARHHHPRSRRRTGRGRAGAEAGRPQTRTAADGAPRRRRQLLAPACRLGQCRHPARARALDDARGPSRARLAAWTATGGSSRSRTKRCSAPGRRSRPGSRTRAPSCC